MITGAYGFVGTNLSSHLAQIGGYSLIALEIMDSINKHYIAHNTWEDLDRIDWDGLESVIHLAGKSHDTNNSSDFQSYFDINCGLTKKVFDRFLHSEASKFIFFSSVKAVADTVPGEYLLEATLPNPQTPYGRSKLQAEQYILGQSLPSGKQIYVIRPCMIHGPGNQGNLNLLYALVNKGLPWPLGAYENKRSFTSIGNLLFVMHQLIEKDVKPGTYQLADDEPLSTNQLIQLITNSLNKRTRIWNISPKAIMVLVKIGDIFNLPLNSERYRKLTESYVVTNQKLKNALGIEKMPLTANEGMKLTLESFNYKNF